MLCARLQCPPGSFSEVPNAASCTLCPPSTFQASDGQPSCEAARPTCEAGTFELQALTPTSNRRCEPCRVTEDEYQPEADQSSCLTLATCAPGTAVEQSPTSIRPRTCTSCLLGTSFSAFSNQPACDAVRSCEPGTEVSAEPTLLADRGCRVRTRYLVPLFKRPLEVGTG